MNLELKKQIKEAKKKLTKASQAYTLLIRTCKHETIIKEGSYEGAVCDTCGSGFGWYCPESPDHTCHYNSVNGLVTLIDGRTVPIPEEHDPDYESDDSCIFCGEPDERK